MDFGLRIGLEGEKEFKASLRDINQNFKVLASEMQLVSSQFDKNDKSMQALASRKQGARQGNRSAKRQNQHPRSRSIQRHGLLRRKRQANPELADTA